MKRHRTRPIAAGLLAVVLLPGCANLTPTQQRAATGTLIGAGGGAVIGAIAGNAGMGAAIGAGAGLLGGLIVDQHEQSKQRAYQDGYRAGKSSR